jgi:hypothetical protein
MIPHLISVPNDSSDRETLSRSGYTLPDLVSAVDRNMKEIGPVATGKLMHAVADLVCSGGYNIFSRICFEHSFENIGIASPRIFLYLRRRFRELDDLYERLETETFYNNIDVQRKISEISLIIQTQPRRPKLKLPTTDTKVHGSREWLKAQLRAPDSAAVKKVWQSSHDQPELLNAANEMLFAAQEGALSRALFWLKWMLDEDAMLRKELKGTAGLTTMDRGGGATKKGSAVSQYIAAVLAEAYKDLAGKGFIRMHEEFQGLLDTFRSSDTRITGRRRTDCLVIMLQIITEVPRLKVPGAPELIKDKIAMERSVGQCGIFFREVLSQPPLSKQLPKTIGKKKTTKPKKGQSFQDQDKLYDDILDMYFNKF